MFFRRIFFISLVICFVVFFFYGLMVVKEKTSINYGKNIVVYFLNGEKLFAVIREAPEGVDLYSFSLQKLLEGPTDKEEFQNIYSLIPHDLEVKKILKGEAHLEITFSSLFKEIDMSMASLNALLSQIVFTLTQFKEIDNIKIRVEGQQGESFAIGDEGYIIGDFLSRESFKE